MVGRATSLAVALALTLTPAIGAGSPTSPGDRERLVFLLQYIGVDYGEAVRDGKVIHAVEYKEMVDFARVLVDESERLGRDVVSRDVGSELRRLQELIWNLGDPTEVRALVTTTVPRLIEDLGVTPYPLAAPDLERGAALYASDCAACHGARGGGDGFAAAGQDPPPTSFRGPRTRLLSPYQVVNAARVGVEHTAMPSYEDARSAADLWDVAFHVMTLRDGFAPATEPPPRSIPLRDLAQRSDEELLAGGAVAPAELDWLRAHPPAPGRAALLEQALRSEAAGATGEDAGGDLGVDLALALEHAFTRVADRVFPGVAGVTILAREASAAARPDGEPAWRKAATAENPYPGYRAVGSASAFFLSTDGYLVTTRDAVIDPGAERPAEIVDVELAGNLHYRARVVGVEPSINLAVLKIDVPFPTTLPPLGNADRVRVGQWAIVLGDPPGPERVFVTGTISARPERDCYQEQRTATLLQTSIRTDPRAYGGPLSNVRGEVVGLAVPRVPGQPDGEIFALPIGLVQTIYGALKERESQHSPWLGVAMLELTWQLRQSMKSAPRTGVVIEDVFDPSPAAAVGIRPGDVLTAMDGNRLLSVADFQRWLYLLGIGHRVRLTIAREGATFDVEATIAERPPQAAMR